MVDFLKEYIQNIGIELNQDKINKLINYYELLIEKNKVMNLTAITEYKDVVIKHFADSLSIIKAVNMSEVTNIIDIGTGAGFPGMVLKIVFPDVKITLLDSLNKRVNFLNEVITELQLKDINAIHGRAEDYARYDLLLSNGLFLKSSVRNQKPNSLLNSYTSGQQEVYHVL